MFIEGKHEVDDVVKLKRPVKNLRMGREYTIRHISRGIDGAYDFDDIYLKKMDGTYISGSFCEFDFETVRRGS